MQSRRCFLGAAAVAGLGIAKPAHSVVMQMRTPSESPEVFSKWLAIQGKKLPGLSPVELVDAALGFYSQVRCAGLESAQHSDMLLFQWGVYDWGQGAGFEFDLTRQFTTGKRGDADMSQFRLTAYFEPTKPLKELQAGNRWCEGLSDIEAFRAFIFTSGTLALVAKLIPKRIVATWSPV